MISPIVQVLLGGLVVCATPYLVATLLPRFMGVSPAVNRLRVAAVLLGSCVVISVGLVVLLSGVGPGRPFPSDVEVFLQTDRSKSWIPAVVPLCFVPLVAILHWRAPGQKIHFAIKGSGIALAWLCYFPLCLNMAYLKGEEFVNYTFVFNSGASHRNLSCVNKVVRLKAVEDTEGKFRGRVTQADDILLVFRDGSKWSSYMFDSLTTKESRAKFSDSMTRRLSLPVVEAGRVSFDDLTGGSRGSNDGC